jgi:hypothetical protein
VCMSEPKVYRYTVQWLWKSQTELNNFMSLQRKWMFLICFVNVSRRPSYGNGVYLY